MGRIPVVREDDPATPPDAREFLMRVQDGLGEIFNAVRSPIILRTRPLRGISLVQQMIEICFNVGLAQINNRFTATFLPEVDDYISEANEIADHAAGSCPIHYPAMPTHA